MMENNILDLLEKSPLVTDHMVDDFPESETALHLFHGMSKFSHLNCIITPDGRQMEYSIRDLTRRNLYLHMARLTIRMFSMPLVAELIVVEKFATATQATLIIKYTGK